MRVKRENELFQQGKHLFPCPRKANNSGTFSTKSLFCVPFEYMFMQKLLNNSTKHIGNLGGKNYNENSQRTDKKQQVKMGVENES